MIRDEAAGNALEALGKARAARDDAQAEVRELKRELAEARGLLRRWASGARRADLTLKADTVAMFEPPQ